MNETVYEYTLQPQHVMALAGDDVSNHNGGHECWGAKIHGARDASYVKYEQFGDDMMNRRRNTKHEVLRDVRAQTHMLYGN